jgi:NADPH:quinone reductase-like Zn-dependent oxidoreductase
MPRFPREAAAYAEYATAPSRQLARVPDGLGDVEAAALPLAGLPAWQALVETAGVERGTRVLVLAAAGGGGHLAVQIAKARGAWVAGTARAEKHAFMRGLGVEVAIDYTSDDLAKRLPGGVDAVLDAVGGEAALAALPALRDGGLVVTLSGASVARLREAAGDQVRVTSILVEPDRCGLEELAALVERGELRPHVERTFPLAQAGAAHELGETGRTTGKLVLVTDGAG